ncbi:MAG TPA: tetratricopeptide repeat protein [Mycobacteriales bacterium]|nr:tetratricopeptide repeat protein [Mycobacteriales bacterium]
MGDGDPDGALAAFKGELARLRADAGAPSLRTMMAQSELLDRELARATLADLFRGEHLPSWPNVETVLVVLDALARSRHRPLPPERTDPDRWRARYLQVREAVEAVRRWGRPLVVGQVPPLAAHFQRRGTADELDAVLADGSLRSAVLSGLGGAGKTQLAADLVARAVRERRVDLVVWINADSRESVLRGYARALSELDETDGSDLEESAERFLDRLGTTPLRWLVVLDDLAEPGVLHGLWPSALGPGRTVVTTRRRDAALAAGGRRMVPVRLFTPAEAADYLRGKLEPYGELTAGAEELAADLGLLPLALSQAAAYIADRRISCADYRDRLAAQGLAAVIPEPAALPDDQALTLSRIWALSVDRADELSPAGLARPALVLLSVLDPNGVPVLLFGSGPALAYLREFRPAGPADGRDALACLDRLSLVDLDARGRTELVRVHALVQRATRDRLSPSTVDRVVRTAADALLAVWPEREVDADLAQALRSNAAAVLAYDADGLWRAGVHPLHVRLGRSLGESGDLAAAVELFARLARTAADRLGRQHLDTVRARGEHLYWRAERGDAGAVLADQDAVVAELTALLGPDDPEVLLALVYRHRWSGLSGHPRDGAVAMEAVAARLAVVVGPDHETTLTARNDIAHLRAASGQVEQAIADYEELLKDRTRVFGPEHPHVIITHNGLAFWLSAAGEHRRALTEYTALTGVAERALGRHHPNTLAIKASALRVRGLLGDAPAAAAELSELLNDFIRVLGAEHPRTVRTKEYLAALRRTAQS